MKVDNKGFSLAELIIVVGIMAVLIGVTGVGIGMLGDKPAEECAKKTELMLKQCQRRATGCVYNLVTIKKDEKGNVVLEQSLRAGHDPEDKEVTVLGKPGLTVSYTLDDGASYVSLEEQPLVFSFDRASASIGFANGTHSYCTEIRIKRGNGTSYYIELIPLTGKIRMK